MIDRFCIIYLKLSIYSISPCIWPPRRPPKRTDTPPIRKHLMSSRTLTGSRFQGSSDEGRTLPQGLIRASSRRTLTQMYGPVPQFRSSLRGLQVSQAREPDFFSGGLAASPLSVVTLASRGSPTGRQSLRSRRGGRTSLQGITREFAQKVDRHAVDVLGLPSICLMENAGSGATRLISEQLPGRRCVCVVLAGPGSNGGDGAVVARHLALEGHKVTVISLQRGVDAQQGRASQFRGTAGASPREWTLASDGRRPALSTERASDLGDSGDSQVDCAPDANRAVDARADGVQSPPTNITSAVPAGRVMNPSGTESMSRSGSRELRPAGTPDPLASPQLLSSPQQPVRRPAPASDRDVQMSVVRAMGIPVMELGASDDVFPVLATLRGVDCVVDALFGTGLTRPLNGAARALARSLRCARDERVARSHAGTSDDRTPWVVSLDVPSGLDCDTGIPLEGAVQADLTITFVAPKTGFAAPGARRFTGDVAVVSIGAPMAPGE